MFDKFNEQIISYYSYAENFLVSTLSSIHVIYSGIFICLNSFESPNSPIITGAIMENTDSNKGLVTLRNYLLFVLNTIGRYASGPSNNLVAYFKITNILHCSLYCAKKLL